jgi:hypothetical protein
MTSHGKADPSSGRHKRRVTLRALDGIKSRDNESAFMQTPCGRKSTCAQEGLNMNKTIIAALAAFITMGTMLASVEEANAVVVVRRGAAVHRGVVRRGAVVRRAPVVVAPRRAVIVR